jgi:hypothetical protein
VLSLEGDDLLVLLTLVIFCSDVVTLVERDEFKLKASLKFIQINAHLCGLSGRRIRILGMEDNSTFRRMKLYAVAVSAQI